MNAEKRREWERGGGGGGGVKAEKRIGGESVFIFCQKLGLQVYLVLIPKLSSETFSLTFPY